MTWRRELALGVFPVLAALYPVLSLAARNSGAGFVTGFGRAVLGAVAVGAAAWGLSALLTRDPHRRTLAALAVVVWFSFFGVLGRAAEGTPLGSRPALLVASLVLLALVLVAVARARRDLASAARIARLTTGIVLAFPLAALALQLLRPGARTPAPAAAAASAPAADASLPDIYLILLDKYTGTRALMAQYRYDNRPFEARLQRLGFTVGNEAGPNYPHTWLALPSLLNWQYADSLLAGQPQGEWMRTLHVRVEDNRAARYLKQRGYEYVFVPSSFPFTQTSALADRTVEGGRRGGMDVWSAWVAETPLGAAPAGSAADAAEGSRFPYPIETGAEVQARLDAIAAIAGERRGRPRFVFAHMLVPHEPYVWHADCSPRDPLWPASDYGEGRPLIQRAYLEQITCLNGKLEQMVGQIIQRSAVPPVILLQSDHGHAFMAMNPMTGEQLPRAQMQPGQVEERMDAFGAYYLPGGGAAALYDSITAVNLLPAVLNHYLKAEIALQPDEVFWATLHPPFNLERLR